MPTTIPMSQHRARATVYAGGRTPGRIVALGQQAWGELQDILRSNDFRTVATFSGIGLLVGLIAMIAGVQGVWM